MEAPRTRHSTERALGDTWVTPTRHGLDRVGLNLPVWKVPVTRVRHCHAVNIVRLYYEATPAANASPWAERAHDLPGARQDHTWHIPDGVIKDPKHIDTEGPPRFIAIEIELTHKGRRIYQTEVFGNLRSGISAVSYFVPDQAFADRLSSDIRAVLEAPGFDHPLRRGASTRSARRDLHEQVSSYAPGPRTRDGRGGSPFGSCR